jgi:hypothetical protein
MDATFLADIENVVWAKLDGAYGPSLGSYSVGNALRTLAVGSDDENQRDHAFDCLLWSYGTSARWEGTGPANSMFACRRWVELVRKCYLHLPTENLYVS